MLAIISEISKYLPVLIEYCRISMAIPYNKQDANMIIRVVRGGYFFSFWKKSPPIQQKTNAA